MRRDRDALCQNNSCNDVGHDHYNKLYYDDKVRNYYVLPWFNYLPLSVYKLFYMQYNLIVFLTKFSINSQARQTRPNSGGVAEGHPRFHKGGVAIIFSFLRVKNITF